MNIKAPDLLDVCSEILDAYGASMSEVAEEASRLVANDVAKELRSAGTFNGGDEFRRGWAVKVTKTRIGNTYTVYNKTKPGLAHLLEFGHAKRNGGRTRAFNFIAPISDTIEEKYRTKLTNLMTRGG